MRRYTPAVAAALALSVACSAADHATPAAQPAAAAATGGTPPGPAAGCLPGNEGFLRARLRGALDLDIDWPGDVIECTGGARPDGSGLRVTIAGPLQSDGRRVRFVFGIAGGREGIDARDRPTNVTVIFEGERRIFATQGDDKCTIDRLTQQRTGPLGGPERSWRVEARGFCLGPAATLKGDERLYVTSFDFAGRIDLRDEPTTP
ncbi:MAG: hypothetical protein NAOJABEB_02436 [Steroidobacteraceae bacterium]|nr:hypothetical protein [Steroidobacteraceae bacterium]